MDNRVFDDLTKRFAASPSRRRLLQGAIGALAAGALLRLSLADTTAACKTRGKQCQNDSDCCSGKCRGNEQKTCRGGGVGRACSVAKQKDKCNSEICACGANPDASHCQAPTYDQGFEQNLKGWFDWDDKNSQLFPPVNSIQRVRSGHGALGVDSSSGKWHAEIAEGTQQIPGSLTAFSTLGGYSLKFPKDGFDVSIDIHLDPDGASPNTFFAYSVAINTNVNDDEENPDNCQWGDEWMFHGGTEDTDFCVGAGGGASSNPCGTNVDPINITEAGWYRFVHEYRPGTDPSHFHVTLRLLDDQGNPVKEWPFGDQPILRDEVGGNRYAWFPRQHFDFLAIDNVTRTPA